MATEEHICVNDMRLKDLGSAGGMTGWGVRASVLGKGEAPEVIESFEWAVGADARRMLDEIATFVTSMASDGRRKVQICCPCSHGVSADEVSLAAMLEAAQSGRFDEMQAHATWLYAAGMPSTAAESACRIGALYASHGLFLRRLPIAHRVHARIAEVDWNAHWMAEAGHA